jgi:integrase
MFMRIVTAKMNYVALHENGAIHYPFTKFLTEEFDNPHTRELAAAALRILHRFFKAHGIELAMRALEGRCLTYDEIKSLAALSYRPLEELDMMSNTKVVRITSAMRDLEPSETPGAVEQNTARKRNVAMACYLRFYRETFLDPHIRSLTLRETLREAYDSTQEKLKGQIAGTKENHHLTIRSLPSERFLKIIRKVVLEPEHLFLTASGKPSATLWRDRAMVLVACEGVRPGTIGNIARLDFLGNGYLKITDNRLRRLGRQTTGTPVLKLGRTTQVSSASEGMLSLYPFTSAAIEDYLELERKPILAKHLKNRSIGFLFLNEKGEPIKHRSSITEMFNRLGARLGELGLLDVGNDPYFHDQQRYDFSGYVLRHSAASFYLQRKGASPATFREMEMRFGWVFDSPMVKRYADRALSDAASINLQEFYDGIVAESAARRTNSLPSAVPNETNTGVKEQS